MGAGVGAVAPGPGRGGFFREVTFELVVRKSHTRKSIPWKKSSWKASGPGAKCPVEGGERWGGVSQGPTVRATRAVKTVGGVSGPESRWRALSQSTCFLWAGTVPWSLQT